MELFESKEVKLLIFTLISFILGMQKKQEQTHETAAALAKENEKVNIRDDQETLEQIKKTNFPLRQRTYETSVILTEPE